jgi:hypothetical protein
MDGLGFIIAGVVMLCLWQPVSCHKQRAGVEWPKA